MLAVCSLSYILIYRMLTFEFFCFFCLGFAGYMLSRAFW